MKALNERHLTENQKLLLDILHSNPAITQKGKIIANTFLVKKYRSEDD